MASPAPAVGSSNGSTTLTQESLQQTFEQSVSLLLHLWPALSLAVTNNWGGPDSADKRDWFAGAIVELFENDPQTDEIDVEEVLIQVMSDEFEVVVDDGSATEVANDVLRIRKEVLLKGDTSEVERLRERWSARKGKDTGAAIAGVFRKGQDDEGRETDWDSEESEDGDEDVVMDEAPPLVRAPREKVEPEVDEDGFTMVTKKKR
ncbi:Pre-rRNA-processing protein TSR2-domain-containing protein [Xylogone sp. PMI_703]|nr:Pre-rRNA-processing protein TSR2-domain-containing protein [Xylogone sp. PMI_703]